MPDVNLGNDFYGDGREGEHPSAFIDRVARQFLLNASTISTDAMKLGIIETLFPRRSTARIWFDQVTKATTGAITTWDSTPAAGTTPAVVGLREAFELEWPDVAPAPKTAQEKKAELFAEASSLTEDNMVTWVDVAGIKEMKTRVWVKAILRLARQVPDTTGLFIEEVKERMPAAIRRHMVMVTTTSWAEFKTEIDAFTMVQLVELREEGKRFMRQDKQEAEVRSLTATLNSMRMARNSAPPGRQQNTSISQAPPVPTPYNPRATPAPVPNPSSRVPPPPGVPWVSRPAAIRLMDAERNAKPIYTNITDYDAAFASWMQTGGRPNEYNPPPLRPGGARIGSGECFNCAEPIPGTTEPQMHMSTECTSTNPLPTEEQKWRSIFSYLVRNRDRRPDANIRAVDIAPETRSVQEMMDELNYYRAQGGYPLATIQGNV